MCDKSWCVLDYKKSHRSFFFLLIYEMERGHVFKPYLGHWSYLAMFQGGREAVNHYHRRFFIIRRGFPILFLSISMYFFRNVLSAFINKPTTCKLIGHILKNENGNNFRSDSFVKLLILFLILKDVTLKGHLRFTTSLK